MKEEFNVPNEAGLNEEIQKINQISPVNMHNQKNPLIKRKKKTYINIFSSDSLVKLAIHNKNSYLNTIKNSIDHNFQHNIKELSFIYFIPRNEEAQKQKDLNKISSFGIQNLRKKEIDELVNKNIAQNKILNKTRRIEDFPKNQRLEIMNCFDKMMTLPKIEDNMITNYQINLENQINNLGKKTLLLDLDETLIYCLYPNEKYDKDKVKNLKVSFFLDSQKMRFIKRPFLNEFLEFASKYYEVLIYTSSIKNYSSAIVQKIDPNNKYILKILSRSQCFLVDKGLIKDIRILGNRKPENIIIVDNKITSFYTCIDNGIYIESFYGNPDDNKLLQIIPFLEKIHLVEDVRKEIQAEYGIKEMYKNYVKGIEYARHRNVSSILIPKMK